MARVQTPRTFAPLSALGDEDFLSPDHLANVLGISKEALRRWRRDGIGPQFRRIGPRLVRVRAGDVRQWLEKSRCA